MNASHLRFARSHDWGKNAHLVGGVMLGIDDTSEVNARGHVVRKPLVFTCPKGLMKWAGY